MLAYTYVNINQNLILTFIQYKQNFIYLTNANLIILTLKFNSHMMMFYICVLCLYCHIQQWQDVTVFAFERRLELESTQK